MAPPADGGWTTDGSSRRGAGRQRGRPERARDAAARPAHGLFRRGRTGHVLAL